jgi:hypothetical protein
VLEDVKGIKKHASRCKKMIFSPWHREARQGTPKNDFFFQVPGRAPRDNKGTTKDVEGQPQCQNTC